MATLRRGCRLCGQICALIVDSSRVKVCSEASAQCAPLQAIVTFAELDVLVELCFDFGLMQRKMRARSRIACVFLC